MSAFANRSPRRKELGIAPEPDDDADAAGLRIMKGITGVFTSKKTTDKKKRVKEERSDRAASTKDNRWANLSNKVGYKKGQGPSNADSQRSMDKVDWQSQKGPGAIFDAGLLSSTVLGDEA